MRPLSTLRDIPDETRTLDAAASRTQTVADSVAAYRSLYAAFAQQLDATEPLFRADREHHLRALQATLRCLGGPRGGT
jgi:hypothetical protein